MKDEDDIPGPNEIGRILAMSLGDEAKRAQPNPREQAMARDAGLSWSSYDEERLLLYGSAYAFAIEQFLRKPEVFQDVSSGYFDQWKDFGNSSPEGSKLFKLYLNRTPRYKRAASQDLAKFTPARGEIRITEVSMIFRDCLSQRSTLGNRTESACSVLAISLGPVHWRTHIDAAEQLFHRARLL